MPDPTCHPQPPKFVDSVKQIRERVKETKEPVGLLVFGQLGQPEMVVLLVAVDAIPMSVITLPRNDLDGLLAEVDGVLAGISHPLLFTGEVLSVNCPPVPHGGPIPAPGPVPLLLPRGADASSRIRELLQGFAAVANQLRTMRD